MAQDSNGADIISSLHDSAICHIMPRLSTRDAVQTMDMILELPRDLKSVRVVYFRSYTDDCYTRWITAALRRNIEIFEFNQHHPISFIVPIGLLSNYTSLRTLKLTCHLKVPSHTKFPYLTDLFLQNVEILNEQSDNKLVITFPVLKTIVLLGCRWRNVEFVDIRSPKLRTFKCITWDFEENDHLITIYGASLDKFESSGEFRIEQIRLQESTVHTAALLGQTQSVESCVQARSLLHGFSNLVKLELSASLCEVLARSSNELELRKFDRLVKPRFNRLMHLEMSLGGNSELLFEFLNSSPSLEFLKFYDGLVGVNDLEWYSVAFDYVEVDSVPVCVQSHLKEVVFINITFRPLIILAEYFLQHGSKLEKVYIEDDKLQRTEVIARLRNFPKASPDAQIFPPGTILY